MTNPTPEQITAGLEALRAVADAIRDAKRIPAGTLYAVLMEAGCSKPQFDIIIDLLKSADLVREEHHELIWIGR